MAKTIVGRVVSHWNQHAPRKIPFKACMRVCVMVGLAHVTGGLLAMGIYWGTIPGILGCAYQFVNGLMFIAEDPMRLTRTVGNMFVRLSMLNILAAATGFLIMFGSITGTALIIVTAVLAGLGIFLTVDTIRFMFRNDPTPK